MVLKRNSIQLPVRVRRFVPPTTVKPLDHDVQNRGAQKGCAPAECHRVSDSCKTLSYIFIIMIKIEMRYNFLSVFSCYCRFKF